MKYVVKVGYNKYMFHDIKEAVDFALIAKTHCIEPDKADKEVRIKFYNDDEEVE